MFWPGMMYASDGQGAGAQTKGNTTLAKGRVNTGGRFQFSPLPAELILNVVGALHRKKGGI